MKIFKLALFAIINSISSCTPPQPDTWAVVVRTSDARKLTDDILDAAKTMGLQSRLNKPYGPKENPASEFILGIDGLVSSLELYPSMNEVTLFSNLTETTQKNRPLLLSLFKRFCGQSSKLVGVYEAKQTGSVALPTEIGCPPLDPLNDKRLR